MKKLVPYLDKVPDWETFGYQLLPEKKEHLIQVDNSDCLCKNQPCSHKNSDLQEGVLYAHHFNTQILPPLNSYINEQPMHVCKIANSSSICFS